MSITSRRIDKCPTPKQRFSDKFPTARTDKMTNSWQIPTGMGMLGIDWAIIIIIWSKFLFLFIGPEPTTWPANNCLQIMVCSCAMLSNCVWLWRLAANNILLIHKRNYAFLLAWKWQTALLREDIHGDQMIKQLPVLLNSVITKYHDLSLSRPPSPQKKSMKRRLWFTVANRVWE